MDAARDFFETLYGDADTGDLAIWTLEERRTRWFASGRWHAAAAAVESLARAGQNVYLGVALQNPSAATDYYLQSHPELAGDEQFTPEQRRAMAAQRTRGCEASAVALPGLFIDLDVHGPAHAEEALPPDADSAIALLRSAIDLDPTLLVWSGHGLQGWWLFREPWLLESAEERAEAKALLQRFQYTIIHKAKEHGWNVESTADLARVLRVPGTENRKKGLEPTPVEVIETCLTSRYNPSDIEPFLLDQGLVEQLFPKRERRVRTETAGDLADFDPIQAGCSFLRHCVDDAKALPEPQWRQGLLTVLARCADGEQLAHEYSKPYPRYDAGETAEKFEHAKRGPGPVTCATVRNGLGGADYCTSCPHAGKITSPIQLGRPAWPLTPAPGDDDAPPERRSRELAGEVGAGTAEELPREQEQTPRQPAGVRGANQATVLAKMALRARLELFHTPDGAAYASVPVSGTKDCPPHVETWALQSPGFKSWLGRHYFHEHGRVAGNQALSDAVNTLSGIALHDRPEFPVYTRVAELNGRIYLNLCNPAWQVVAVGPDGWEVTSEAPVKFRRPKGMAALPVPVRGGSIAELRPFVNVTDEQWPLVGGFVVGAIRGRGPFPVAILRGEQDSAKSTTARVFKAIVDPNVSPLRAEPKDDRDLAIGAMNGWVIALDNLTVIHAWLSNALCRMATGGGFSTRELYSNSEETLFDFQRPCVLNGIADVVTAADLLDRGILFELPKLRDNQRTPERQFWQAFDAAHPRILGAFLDAVSVAQRNIDTVQLATLPRMADFAAWVVAAEPALPWKAGDFIRCYAENRREAHSVALDACLISEPLMQLVRGRPDQAWEGTFGELLAALEATAAGAGVRERKSWPSNARSLSVLLKKIAPNLRGEGFEVRDLPKEKAGRMIRIAVAASGDANGDANPDFGDANGRIGDANGQVTPPDQPRIAASDAKDGSPGLYDNCAQEEEREGSTTARERSGHIERDTGEFASLAGLRRETPRDVAVTPEDAPLERVI